MTEPLISPQVASRLAGVLGIPAETVFGMFEVPYPQFERIPDDQGESEREPPRYYFSYYANDMQEGWLFVYNYEAGVATLTGESIDWQALPVTPKIGVEEDVPHFEGLDEMDEGERMWLAACWYATMPARTPGGG